MGYSKNIKIAVVVFIIQILLRNLMADPRTEIAGQSCNSTLAVSGVTLAVNFVPAMANLSSVVNQNGFGTSVAGNGSDDAVYGLAQCFKDLSPIDCSLCFSEIRSLLPRCYPRTGGRIFLDGCFGRYENYRFFDEAIDSNDTKVCFYRTNSSEPRMFSEAVNDVVRNVSLAAQRNGGFAVGSVSHSNLEVYALAQCWENLGQNLCNSCLDIAASSIVSCTPAIEGRSLNAGCYMRYSTEMFWNLNVTASNSSGRSTSTWIIVASSLGGFLLIVAIAVWKAKGFLKRSSTKSLTDLYGLGLSAAISQSNLNFKYVDLKKATNNFDLSNKLGQGSYGTVYKGVLSDGRNVAIKRLFLNTRHWVDQFLNEVDLINKIRHKNLVKLLGCSADGPESLLVYEYYFNKSLDQFIFDINKATNLNWRKRLDIIQGVAEGLAYLHEESEVRIIHRDVKASNILLDDKLKPKITDFGLARSFSADQTHLSTAIAGTLGYMAPEYVVHGHLTEKADVYSFGILVLEIVTGQRCTNGAGSQVGQYLLSKTWSHYKSNTVESIIDLSFYEENAKDEILNVVHVGLLCTQATASYRPTMARVVELLRSNRDHRDRGEHSPTDPPFLDVLVMESKEESEGTHLLSKTSDPSCSGSSEFRMSGR